MNLKGLLKFLTLPLLFFSGMVFAQEKLASGKVVDSRDNTPIANATIAVKGATAATATTADGSFQLRVPATATTLVVSSVGYSSKDVAIGSGPIQVTLEQTNAALNEVVVVGYGTQRRRDVTGAIAKVNSEQLNSIPVPSFEAALQGKAAGVQIIQGNGLAGSGSVVRIRGIGSISASGDPLYVVDGIPIISDPFLRTNQGAMNQNPLASINPADIESVEILKDAGATGIYGSRGANGVILITTKRGKNGKPTFNYANKLGISTYANKPDFVNAAEWLQLRQEAWVNDGKTGLADLPNGITRAQASQANTDWWDELTQIGFINEHNLSMNQGNAKLKTFANLSYSNNEGYIKSNAYQRISARLNVDYNILKTLKVSLSSGYNRGVNKRVPAAWDGGIGDAMSGALPIFPVYNADGTYFTGNANPVRRINETKRREIDNRLIGGLSVEFQPITNLFLKASSSIEYTTAIDDQFESYLWTRFSTPDSGYAKRFPYWGTNVSSTATANYLWNPGKENRFNFLLGTETQEYSRKSYTFETGEYAAEPYWKHPEDYRERRDSLKSAVANNVSEQEAYTFNSFFGRVNYSYKDRYSLQLTARVDGSSKFGANNKHGFFPAAAAAWTISEEDFLKGNKFINFLKLRASYGVVGNANMPSGKYYANYRNGGINYNGDPTLYLNDGGYGNPDLKWETMNNVDAAVEFALFDNRLTGEVAYYNKQTTDLLLEPGVSNSAGTGKIFRNVPESKILNEGVEISANLKIVNTNDFKWSVGGNIANNRNEVLEWSLGPDAVTGGTNDTRVVKGLPLGVNYLVRYYGVDPLDGNPIWLDRNGKQTKTYSLDHRVYAGSVMPDFIGGFNTSVEYKGLTLSTLFSFVIGGSIYENSAKYQFAGVSKKFWNVRRDFLDRWTRPGDVSMYPRFVSDATAFPGVSSEDQFNSTMFLRDASYLRMRELTLAYRFPANVLKGLRNIRLFLTGSNLFTWSKYPGGDPEITRDFENSQDRNLSPNITYLTAPSQKTVVFGLNVGF
ncbi:TonB-dependent receptor [Segetibacter sp. 3557_3]|uniref:SusC/RagA family TonB-linked outer membrane protein n=1 Tax=Segetibacter sp. 3557_3 TaxID=2547429 RepID=UPI001058C5E1|nr:TonB-dependent receptor [Segetibacter sp. 3557_3]TDH25137.1 TonB-dependent receptor [Segetibacter sp. 3557_3]